MDVNHKISKFEFEKDGKKAALFCDSELSIGALYDIGCELRGWAIERMQEQNEAQKEQEPAEGQENPEQSEG